MINKEAVLSKIDDLLKELTQKFEHLAKEENVNSLEYELFEVNAIYFAEHAKILRKLLTVDDLDNVTVDDLDNAVSSSEKDVDDEKVPVEKAVFEGEINVVDNDLNLDSAHQEDNHYEEEADEKTEEDSIDSKSLEDSVPDSEEGESSFNSMEKGNGTFESELVIDNDEIVGEEDEVVLEKQNFENQFESRPDIQTEERDIQSDIQTEERDIQSEGETITQKVVVEEREFSFKVEAESHEDKLIEKVSESISVSQSYSASKPESINDRISALRQSQSAGAGSNSNPKLQRIADIKTIINLNDKLLFIKDLFNGYSLAYSEAIELLNRYENFADADKFLQNNYAEKNNWGSKKDTVEKLYAILRKRYG